MYESALTFPTDKLHPRNTMPSTGPAYKVRFRRFKQHNKPCQSTDPDINFHINASNFQLMASKDRILEFKNDTKKIGQMLFGHVSNT